ncbi:hypothetical protein B0H14DRAFT_3452780 [Mycena olivaceomarginata]|nr:hypothetical protein B0H14DRAFT_3452780 [Mycena olivaceomarginata]
MATLRVALSVIGLLLHYQVGGAVFIAPVPRCCLQTLCAAGLATAATCELPFAPRHGPPRVRVKCCAVPKRPALPMCAQGRSALNMKDADTLSPLCTTPVDTKCAVTKRAIAAPHLLRARVDLRSVCTTVCWTSRPSYKACTALPAILDTPPSPRSPHVTQVAWPTLESYCTLAIPAGALFARYRQYLRLGGV